MHECINKLSFSPDDKFLCGISANNMFCIWSVRDGNPIHTKFSEHPLTLCVWSDVITDAKHPSYTLITANYNSMFINRLEFDIASMQYFLKTSTFQLPNTGLLRNYTFASISNDMLLAGTTGGDVCVFSISSSIYRASIPLTSNGIMCGTVDGDFLYVGGGDGKIKKVVLVKG